MSLRSEHLTTAPDLSLFCRPRSMLEVQADASGTISADRLRKTLKVGAVTVDQQEQPFVLKNGSTVNGQASQSVCLLMSEISLQAEQHPLGTIEAHNLPCQTYHCIRVYAIRISIVESSKHHADSFQAKAQIDPAMNLALPMCANVSGRMAQLRTVDWLMA